MFKILELTKKQKEAYDFFNKYNFLVVEAPRRSGKTTLLQAITAANHEKRIAIMCDSHTFFKKYYGEYFKNAFYIEKHDLDRKRFDILIGDEVFVEPKENLVSACAYTKRYVALRWTLEDYEFIDNKQIYDLKRDLTDYAWEKEFGQYK